MLDNYLDVTLVEDVVEFLKPDIPILCISKSKIKEVTQQFLEGFSGTTLYAVKCNPHPSVINTLSEIGVKEFDVASLEEIKLINSLIPEAKCYFNHPIKTRSAIYKAYKEFGIRDFVVDSLQECHKIFEEIGKDVIIQFRLNVISGSEVYDFTNKFGMSKEDIINILEIYKNIDLKWALSFHVGSQCEAPEAYSKAISMCNEIINELDTKPQYINIGGGFPGYYPGRHIAKIHKYFDLIKLEQVNNNLPLLLCEPGRALVCSAGELIVQILGRKSDKLYINDGLYGALGEIDYAALRPKVRAVNKAKNFDRTYVEYTIFGPTCDSFDVLEYKFKLPTNVEEGDWIIISDLGAYSTSLSSNFNGFTSNNIYIIC